MSKLCHKDMAADGVGRYFVAQDSLPEKDDTAAVQNYHRPPRRYRAK